MTLKKKLHILGIRGVPAHHGGFETFAENLSLHLVAQGWDVTVYCQEDDQSLEAITQDQWQGVRRVRIPVKQRGNLTSIVFDWAAVKYAAEQDGLCLVLGYNTAVFAAWLRLKGKTVLFNMDGLEWKRSVWPLHGRAWFFVNEWLGAWFGHHLIADNPEIKKHLLPRVLWRDKITTIAYGAREVINAKKPDTLNGVDSSYALVIGRPVPENNILEIVKSWSLKKRNCLLVVLGRLDPKTPYHQAIKQAAGDQVMLVGGVYDRQEVDALRCNAKFYIHGHTVGGTNPSLVEALGAGNAILAHDNRFNRWVAGKAAVYFKNGYELPEKIDDILKDEAKITLLQGYARTRHANAFRWNDILQQYQTLLERFV
jgi:glycosyltransferase involved in cell wall biosynthesis